MKTLPPDNRTLVERAQALLQHEALAGLSDADRASVVAIAAGMAGERAGLTDEDGRSPRLLGASWARSDARRSVGLRVVDGGRQR